MKKIIFVIVVAVFGLWCFNSLESSQPNQAQQNTPVARQEQKQEKQTDPAENGGNSDKAGYDLAKKDNEEVTHSNDVPKANDHYQIPNYNKSNRQTCQQLVRQQKQIDNNN